MRSLLLGYCGLIVVSGAVLATMIGLAGLAVGLTFDGVFSGKVVGPVRGIAAGRADVLRMIGIS